MPTAIAMRAARDDSVTKTRPDGRLPARPIFRASQELKVKHLLLRLGGVDFT